MEGNSVVAPFGLHSGLRQGGPTHRKSAMSGGTWRPPIGAANVSSFSRLVFLDSRSRIE
jgi:hypothetical protein